MSKLDEVLKEHHDLEMAEYAAAFNCQAALLNKLDVAELRVLLVHFKLAEDIRDAKTWPKPDMVQGLAEHMTVETFA